MKHFLFAILLATVTASCSTNSPGGDQVARTATAHAAIGQLIQRTVGKDFVYKPLKWAEATPLRAEDMGELAVQRQLALWAVDKQRATAFYDTIIGAQELLRNGNTQEALMKAAIVADAVEHRAAERALVVSRVLDSVQRTNPKAAPITAGQRVWHTFQLTNKEGKVKRDSSAFIILSSGTVLHAYPLAQRFWEPDNSDPF
jgi:outer membrane PBP1 activator LpoA protein